MFVRAAFYRNFWNAIFWKGALDFLAGRAGILMDDYIDCDYAWVFLKFAQSNCRFWNSFISAPQAGQVMVNRGIAYCSGNRFAQRVSWININIELFYYRGIIETTAFLNTDY